MAEAQRESNRHASLDISFRPIIIFALGLAVLLVVSFVLVQGILAVLTPPPEPSRPLSAPAPQTPLEPPLQVAPRQELHQLRAREDAALSSYGWIDREAGRVRIPVDRAMELLTQRGLAARPQTPAAPGGQGG
jgi:hypothetical protein